MNSPSSAMISPPSRSALTFIFSAAGFIAMSTSGWSPAVSIASEPKLIWKAETPKVVPCGARIRPGNGEGGEVVAGKRGRQGELPAGQLHAVAAIARKADDHGFERRMGRGFFSVRTWVAVATKQVLHKLRVNSNVDSL